MTNLCFRIAPVLLLALLFSAMVATPTHAQNLIDPEYVEVPRNLRSHLTNGGRQTINWVLEAVDAMTADLLAQIDEGMLIMVESEEDFARQMNLRQEHWQRRVGRCREHVNPLVSDVSQLVSNPSDSRIAVVQGFVDNLLVDIEKVAAFGTAINCLDRMNGRHALINHYCMDAEEMVEALLGSFRILEDWATEALEWMNTAPDTVEEAQRAIGVCNSIDVMSELVHNEIERCFEFEITNFLTDADAALGIRALSPVGGAFSCITGFNDILPTIPRELIDMETAIEEQVDRYNEIWEAMYEDQLERRFPNTSRLTDERVDRLRRSIQEWIRNHR